jgi:hypothetical protein
MAYDDIVIGAAANSKIVEVMLRDSSTGQAKTGVVYGSVAYSYIREGSDATKATGTCVAMVLDTYTDHGWIETGIAGVYQFGIPQAALAAGKNAVTLKLVVSGVLDVKLRILIAGVDLRDGVRGGMTALPNAVAGEAGGVALVGSEMDWVDSPNTTALTVVVDAVAEGVLDSYLPDWDGQTSTLGGILYHNMDDEMERGIGETVALLQQQIEYVEGAGLWRFTSASLGPAIQNAMLSSSGLTWDDAKADSVVYQMAQHSGGAGLGRYPTTLTWTNSTTGLPVVDGEVKVTSDAAGLAVVGGPKWTDAQGRVVFLLNHGAALYLQAAGASVGAADVIGQAFTAAKDA